MADEQPEFSPNDVQPEHRKLTPHSRQKVQVIRLLLREYFENAQRFDDADKQAIDFIRAHPSCVISIPQLRDLEEVLARERIEEVWRKDLSRTAKADLAAFYDKSTKQCANVMRARNKPARSAGTTAKPKRGRPKEAASK